MWADGSSEGDIEGNFEVSEMRKVARNDAVDMALEMVANPTSKTRSMWRTSAQWGAPIESEKRKSAESPPGMEDDKV